MVSRGLDMGVRTIELQWVNGGTVQAEESFKRINREVSTVSARELELIDNRKYPNAIAARAIWRRAEGHQYWSPFDADKREKVRELAISIHDLMFEPLTDYPIQATDLSACGPVHAGLGLVYDFVNLCVETPSVDPDKNGDRTVAYLSRAQRVMRRVSSKHPSSLALHPAIYFYSWAGRYAQTQFLPVAEFIIQIEKQDRLDEFTKHRADFEEYLAQNRAVQRAVMRAIGTSKKRREQGPKYYMAVLEALSDGVSREDVFEERIAGGDFGDVRKYLESHTGSPGKKFSGAVKSGSKMRLIVEQAPRCAICKGYLPLWCVSWDHKTDRPRGTSAASNAQATHPFCNSTFKRSLDEAPTAE